MAPMEKWECGYKYWISLEFQSQSQFFKALFNHKWEYGHRLWIYLGSQSQSKFFKALFFQESQQKKKKTFPLDSGFAPRSMGILGRAVYVLKTPGWDPGKLGFPVLQLESRWKFGMWLHLEREEEQIYSWSKGSQEENPLLFFSMEFLLPHPSSVPIPLKIIKTPNKIFTGIGESFKIHPNPFFPSKHSKCLESRIRLEKFVEMSCWF